MSDLALSTIRLLRKLPRTASFDAHLTNCAALAVFYGPMDDSLEKLRLAHVVRLAPLPNFFPSFLDAGDERIEATMPRHDSGRGKMTPVVIDCANLFQNRSRIKSSVEVSAVVITSAILRLQCMAAFAGRLTFLMIVPIARWLSLDSKSNLNSTRNRCA
jgi:hypothetical protein